MGCHSVSTYSGLIVALCPQSYADTCHFFQSNPVFYNPCSQRLFLRQGIYKNKIFLSALADVAQWIECRLVNQRVLGLIPSLGHMPGLWAKYPVGGSERQPHIDVSLPLFLLPFPSLKINKSIPKKKRNFLIFSVTNSLPFCNHELVLCICVPVSGLVIHLFHFVRLHVWVKAYGVCLSLCDLHLLA